jgi:hypothetical protein
MKIKGILNIVGIKKDFSLPEGLCVSWLMQLIGAVKLKSLPRDMKIGGWINLLDCQSLLDLPDDIFICGGVWYNKETGFIAAGQDIHELEERFRAEFNMFNSSTITR